MEYLQILSHGNILRGARHSARFSSDKSPIIIVHGYFSANRNGPQRLFIEIANNLSQIGFTVYRFDLSAMGESEGNIKEINFQKHVEDLGAIIRFVKQQHEGLKINLIAHSLGCNLALEQIIEDVGLFNNIIFLAPFLTNSITLQNIFNDTNKIKELEEKNFTYRKGLYADKSYFIESQVSKVIELLRSVSINIDIFIAKEDQFIPSSMSIEIFGKVKNINVSCLSNADHNFLETHQALSDAIIKIFTI